MDTDDVQPPKETAVKAVRDPVTGQFLKGTAAGPGRPKGSKDKLNVQVIDTLEKLWNSRGAEILDQLAAEKPEVVMAMVSRLIPQQLAAEAITGEVEKGEGNQEVRITLINQVKDDALPHHEVPRLVEGEVMDEVDTTH
jgi:hypothetical protein